MDAKSHIQEALAGIEPMLRSAGRAIEIVDADEAACTVKLTGFCGGCACSDSYKEGIQELVEAKAPGTKVTFIEA